MINETTLTEEPTKLYPLDKSEFEIEITASEFKVQHKLRKPTLSELIERDQQTVYETEEVAPNEDRVNIDNERANARLWDKIAIAVKEYEIDASVGITIDPEVWTPVTLDITALVPSGHKVAAINGLYQTEFEMLKDEKKRYVMGGQSYVVKQTFGEYEILHKFRAPSEAEARYFKRKASDTRFSRGSRKVKTRIFTDLKVHIEMYDKLVVSVGGVAGSSELVDPVWKRGAIDCFMRFIDNASSD